MPFRSHALTSLAATIQYMRVQRAGQATLIPLETIKAKPANDKFRNFARGARLAIDVISFDNAVERAMQHACGDALVCDSMEVARHVCYEKGQEIKGEFGGGLRCFLKGGN